MRSIRHRSSAWILCFVLGASSLAPGASLAAERSAAGEFGIGAASVLCTFVYGTVKLGYATLGALTAGFAYVLSGGNADVSQVVLQRSLRGDYVVTPEVLTGQDSLVFVGRDPVNEPSPSDVPDASQAPEQTEPYPY